MSPPQRAGRDLRLLLVEDNPADVDLMKEVLHECGITSEILVAKDGREALDKIRSSEPPEIVFLDLNLGVTSGHEVLEELQKTMPEFLALVPIIVLTSSVLPSDVKDALMAGAKCYHIKPSGLKPYLELIRVIFEHWFQHAVLPLAQR